MSHIVNGALSTLRNAWDHEPAHVVSVGVSIIVFVCAKVGIIVPQQSVGAALALILPVLLGGALIRSQVTPAAKQASSTKG